MASSNGEQPPESPKEANAAPVAAKLAMASGRDGCERLKDLVSREDDATTMVVAMATSKNVDDTRRPPPPRVIMDPQLLMAARNGACQSLESLLLGHEVRCQTLPESHLIIYLPEPDEGAPTTDPIEDQAEGISATDQQASGAVYSLSLLEGLTLDSDENSALHVVAASGDSQAYVECARMVYDQARHLLGAANNNGDTPLHCAAAAGNHSSRWLLLRLRVTAAVQRGWMTRSS